MLPPISETQLLTISLVVLLCGLGIGFILGSLWMEQRFKKKAAADNEDSPSAQERSSDQDQRRDTDNPSGNARISA